MAHLVSVTSPLVKDVNNPKIPNEQILFVASISVFIADKIQSVSSAGSVMDQSQWLLQDSHPVQQSRLSERRPTVGRVFTDYFMFSVHFFVLAEYRSATMTTVCLCVLQCSFEIPGHSVPAEGECRGVDGARLEGDGASVAFPRTDRRQHRATALHPWRRCH